ncbi:beta family protein [Bradyrhizobium liaoningense]
MPRLVIPPPKERDPEKGRPLTQDEIIYETGRRIAAHWPLRDALLDTKFLYRELDESKSEQWLPRIFEISREAGARPIPLASLSDVKHPRKAGLRHAISTSSLLRLGLRVAYSELDEELSDRIASSLDNFKVDPEHCAILVDFADADFSDVDAVAEIAQRSVEDLQAIGRWRQIVFQGTNYPSKNPAQPGATEIVPRNEWLAWKKAVRFDKGSPDQLVFGDYAADCAEFRFGQSGGIPIRHYRYTTVDSWLVVRGTKTGDATQVMRDVCRRILASGHFAGRQFSSADDYIFRTAKGWDGPGNGSTWREINTAHHITRVVRDLGTIKGLTFNDVQVVDPADQLSFLDV